MKPGEILAGLGLRAERVRAILGTPEAGPPDVLPSVEHRRYSPRQRQLIRDLLGCGLSQDQVAERLRIPRGSIVYLARKPKP
jgi:DNA-binding NarL/FixJ family response regulator